MRMNFSMMKSSNGNIFRVTCLSCGEFTGHRSIWRYRSYHCVGLHMKKPLCIVQQFFINIITSNATSCSTFFLRRMCIYWAIGQLYTHISLHQNLSRSGCTTFYILWVETLNNKLLVFSGIYSHQAVYKGGPGLSAVRHVIELCCTLLEARRSNDVGYFGHKATDRSFDLVRVIFYQHMFSEFGTLTSWIHTWNTI